jgi:hypothetical protein
MYKLYINKRKLFDVNNIKIEIIYIEIFEAIK